MNENTPKVDYTAFNTARKSLVEKGINIPDINKDGEFDSKAAISAIESYEKSLVERSVKQAKEEIGKNFENSKAKTKEWLDKTYTEAQISAMQDYYVKNKVPQEVQVAFSNVASTIEDDAQRKVFMDTLVNLATSVAPKSLVGANGGNTDIPVSEETYNKALDFVLANKNNTGSTEVRRAMATINTYSKQLKEKESK